LRIARDLFAHAVNMFTFRQSDVPSFSHWLCTQLWLTKIALLPALAMLLSILLSRRTYTATTLLGEVLSKRRNVHVYNGTSLQEDTRTGYSSDFKLLCNVSFWCLIFPAVFVSEINKHGSSYKSAVLGLPLP
jgi:hypothetical protein